MGVLPVCVGHSFLGWADMISRQLLLGVSSLLGRFGAQSREGAEESLVPGRRHLPEGE